MKLLQSTCLRPSYSLGRQLFVAFGSTSALTIGVVMLISTLSAKSSGESVKSQARENLSLQAKENLGSSSRYIAETISKKFDNLGGAVSLMAEVTRDRFAGYPSSNGYSDDRNVPFHDILTGRNAYPLKSTPLPLDWNISNDVNIETQYEHVQDRWSWYDEGLKLSTAYADYRMQGQCDPSVSDPTSPLYYENCSDANNDIDKGGVVNPTPTNKLIADKAADLKFVLKPLYESHEDVKLLGIYFANSGAGSSISFPATENNGTTSYQSIGCSWMSKVNPFSTSSKPIGTTNEIARCHPAGQTVHGRDYNPLEREWCRDQALNPSTTRSVGPYLDAFSEYLWLLTFGRAIFDRVSGSFIGCTLADMSINQVVEIIHSVKIGETSNVALIRWDEGGTIVASSKWKPEKATKTAKITDFDLGMGVDFSTYRRMRSLIDFDAYWSPQDVKDTFKDTMYDHDGKLVSMYPIPVPPDEYEETYHPEYMVVMSIDEVEVFGAVDKMDATIDDDVDRLVRNTLIIGFSGIFFLLLVIWAVSRIITKPFKWMERVSDQIVNNAGSNLVSGIDHDETPMIRCSPRTEVTELVSEFRRMICGFSGGGAARVAKMQVREVKNTFTWNDAFRSLYQVYQVDTWPRNDEPSSREEHQFSSDETLQTSKNISEGTSWTDSWFNYGKNIREPSQIESSLKGPERASSLTGKKCVLSSPLFWWIMVLIVTPLVATMATICTLVTIDITRSLPEWLEDVEAASVTLERDAIVTSSKARAAFSSEVMKQPTRDLHLYARVAGWLLFGGLKRSIAFTDMTTGTEECKVFPADGSCGYFTDETRTPCDCEWDDNHGGPCETYQTSTRHLQKRFYSGQSQDANLTTGFRTSTSYPKWAYSAETTAWWENVQDMPKGTYDRVSVLSALAVAELPLYNYHNTYSAQNKKKENLGTFVGMEADGMMMGYSGCDYNHAEYAHWVSSDFNGAADIRDDLCPLGKFGYDSRCRDWYATGKEKGTRDTGSEPVHITPPYVFAQSNLIASSATSSLLEPTSRTFIGQAVLDFVPAAIINALLPGNTIIGQGSDGFPLVLTPDTDVLGGDTVVAPGFSLHSRAGSPIGDFVLPFDNKLSSNRLFFDNNLLADMKSGKSGAASFKRRTRDGNEEEVFVSYAPVKVRTLRPLYPSAFASGVEASEALIYSLAVAIPEPDLVLPFVEIEQDVKDKIDSSSATLIALVVVTAMVFVCTTYSVTTSIITPIRLLLVIVQNVNTKQIQEDIPAIAGGSREVTEVYHSFEKLYKVVRFSNAAFFSGDLRKAYEVLVEALELFTKLQNKKAIGIASNNLGNIITSMSRENAIHQWHLFGMNNQGLYDTGKEYFDKAICCGTEDYDAAVESGENGSQKAALRTQLANRYFNRGVFYFTARNYLDVVGSFDEEIGYSDILKAKHFDDENRRHWLSREMVAGEEALPFETALGRVPGLLRLVSEYGAKDVWGIRELIQKAERDLSSMWEDLNSPMFAEINRLGRRQQLEGLRIQYALCILDDPERAAKCGMRMLVEDEYIVDTAFVHAMTSLLKFMESSGFVAGAEVGSEGFILIPQVERELRAGCPDNALLSKSKNVMFCLDYSGSMSGGRIKRANKNLLMIYDEYCFGHDHVGFVRFNDQVDFVLRFPPQLKRENELTQKSILNSAVTARGGTNFYTALDHVVDMILDHAPKTHTSWIIALTDGQSWDSCTSVMDRLSELNECGQAINVIIIGYEVPQLAADVCKLVCGVSEDSLFIDARGGLDEMDKAFRQVASIISGGVTMETF